MLQKLNNVLNFLPSNTSYIHISIGEKKGNFLLGKVGDPHITSYVNPVARQTNVRRATYDVVLDIHGWIIPTGRKMVINSRAISAIEAIFEMKIYMARDSRYNHSIKSHPVD